MVPVDDETRQNNRLRVLAEASHTFSEATTDIDRLLRLVAARFADLVGDGCYIRLLAPDGITLTAVATYHPDPEIEGYLRSTTDGITLRVGEGISGVVVQTGTPVLMPQVDFERYRAMTKPQFVPIFERIGVSSLIVVCLRARATNIGFIALVRNGAARPAYTEQDLQLVQDLADRAALAIDNARLLEELERRVLERTRELERVNGELEAFSYSVSHDLRAPLRAINGFSRVLEEDHADAIGDEGRRVVAVIRRNTVRMDQLIHDLLRFSRLGRQPAPSSVVSMRPVIDGVIEELQAADPERDVRFEIGELPDGVCNGELIQQVWANLLGNAVKYTRDREVALVEIHGEIVGDEACYLVTDNGSGFDPRYSAKLFKVFQRLHALSEFEGTGVGLALVHRIVTRYGGRVWAEGQPGVGATFGFALPHEET